jgi:hypothetical protein
MQQWEYKLISFAINLNAHLKIARWELEADGVMLRSEAEVMKYVNQLGVAGWELVTANQGSDEHGNITKIIIFFKRPKTPDAEELKVTG